MKHFYELNHGNGSYGHTAHGVLCDIAPDEHELVVLTEVAYNEFGECIGTRHASASGHGVWSIDPDIEYHANYDVTTSCGVAVLHPSSIKYPSDEYRLIEAALKTINGKYVDGNIRRYESEHRIPA